MVSGARLFSMVEGWIDEVNVFLAQPVLCQPQPLAEVSKLSKTVEPIVPQ